MRTWERAARDDLRAILERALLSVTPQAFLRALMSWDGRGLALRGRAIDLPAGTLRIAAIGKAAGGMAAQLFALPAAERLLVAPGKVDVEGWETIVGEHPMPGEGSLRAGARLLELARSTGPEDALLLLLSGGASSLCEASDLSLAELRETHRALLCAGLPIHEVNAVRKHLSTLKGGRLAAAARGRVVTLAVSDVLGDDLGTIASGPAAPDPTTFRDASDALHRAGIWDSLPRAARQILEDGVAGGRPETPKPGDPVFDRTEGRVLVSNATALEAAAREAARRGYDVEVQPGALVGEARAVGERLAALARTAVEKAARTGRPRALILGGETTVTVRGSGRGGRNQEVALALVEGIAGRPVVAATLATDGVDGPTDAAGAVVDGLTLARAKSLGLEVEEHLAENDAYPYFARLHDLVQTGPTGTNVADLAVVLVGARLDPSE